MTDLNDFRSQQAGHAATYSGSGNRAAYLRELHNLRYPSAVQSARSSPVGGSTRAFSDPFGGQRIGDSVAVEANSSYAIGAAIFSELTSAYANFAAVRSKQAETRSAASSYQHQARMLQLDRRNAERRAQSILEQGQSEIGRVTSEGGQRRAAIRATTSSRGIAVGSQSTREAEASEKLIEATDVYHISVSATREANAARAEAVDIDNRALFARTSARNLRRSARTAAPEAQLFAGAGSAAIRAEDVRRYRRR